MANIIYGVMTKKRIKDFIKKSKSITLLLKIIHMPVILYIITFPISIIQHTIKYTRILFDKIIDVVSINKYAYKNRLLQERSNLYVKMSVYSAFYGSWIKDEQSVEMYSQSLSDSIKKDVIRWHEIKKELDKLNIKD